MRDGYLEEHAYKLLSVILVINFVIYKMIL